MAGAPEIQLLNNRDSKVHGASKGPTWVLSAPDGPHVGPMNLAIRERIGETGARPTSTPDNTMTRVGTQCWLEIGSIYLTRM